MLVVTRKVGQSIRIGEDIYVMITLIDENKVRLGIEAPRAVRVSRVDDWNPKDDDQCAGK